MPDTPTEPADALLRAAVESSPNGLLLTDERGVIVLVNREVERLFGYPRAELLGQSIELLVPIDQRPGHAHARDRFRSAPRARAMGGRRELAGLRKDGTQLPLEIGLTPVTTAAGAYVLAAVVDITARRESEDAIRQLESKLRQAQKMEVVGTLAGGIAHDFNNILGVIIGYVDLLKAMATDARMNHDLHEVEEAAVRGRELVRRILGFARRADADYRSLDVAHVIDQAAQMLRVSLPPRVRFEVRVAPETPHIRADLTSVHLVLLNLGNNAFQAMPQGGLLEFIGEPLYVHDHVARSQPELREGLYAQLTVRDTGTGMDASTRQHVFEPFFTTKPEGSGTGLGLSMVRGIVKEHGGGVILESTPGEGTRVRCLFPAFEAANEEQATAYGDVPFGKGERVLLLDDEPKLVEIGLKQLEKIGYTGTGFIDAEAALEAVNAANPPFSAVLTDYSMPALDGVRFAQRVGELRPGLPVLMLTGFVQEFLEEDFAAIGVRKVLRKPVPPQELAAALHEVITRARDA